MRSMTGYGAAAASVGAARITVEIRGVNQRFLDVRVALPRELAALEREVRETVRGVAERGRVEVLVARSAAPERRRFVVVPRMELARAYVRAARHLARRLEIEGTIRLADVLRLPEIFDVSEAPPDVRRERPAVRGVVARALRAFDAERRREGAFLGRDMRRRLVRLGRITERIRHRLPALTERLRRQAEERLRRLAAGAGVESARIVQEAASLAERSDVSEEMVRLGGHLTALTAALDARGAIGKRMEFLLQEVHRELNTTGAKISDRAIVDLVVAAKGEVEKLREQLQNVE